MSVFGISLWKEKVALIFALIIFALIFELINKCSGDRIPIEFNNFKVLQQFI